MIGLILILMLVTTCLSLWCLIDQSKINKGLTTKYDELLASWQEFNKKKAPKIDKVMLDVKEISKILLRHVEFSKQFDARISGLHSWTSDKFKGVGKTVARLTKTDADLVNNLSHLVANVQSNAKIQDSNCQRIDKNYDILQSNIDEVELAIKELESTKDDASQLKSALTFLKSNQTLMEVELKATKDHFWELVSYLGKEFDFEYRPEQPKTTEETKETNVN